MPYMVNPSFKIVCVTSAERTQLLKQPMVIDADTGRVEKLGFRDATKEEVEKWKVEQVKEDAQLQVLEQKLRMKAAGFVIQMPTAPVAVAEPEPKKGKPVAGSDKQA